MTAQNKTTIKSYFETGDRPSQAQFADLIDSYIDTSAAGTVGLQILGCVTSASALSIIGAQGSLTTGTVGLQILATNTTTQAQQAIGGGSVGIQVYAASTTAAAQQAIGGGTVGRQVYECATTADVQNIVGSSVTIVSANFTPVVEGSTIAGAGTYSIQLGRCNRIGNLVTFNIELAWSAHTGTGTMLVNGLPFSAATYGATALLVENLTTPASTFPRAMVGVGQARVNLYSQTIATGALANLAIDGSAIMYMEGSYFCVP